MSDPENEDEEKGFTVTDKRRFDTEGNPRDERSEPQQGGEERGLPEIDFSTFILSLSTSAMVHLGEAPHPDGAKHKDLMLAKQTIDIIGLLKQKTEGNLTDEEAKLLSDLLYDLRLRYVAATR
jgi:hypothetical protein